jgi:hypothetical protein
VLDIVRAHGGRIGEGIEAAEASVEEELADQLDDRVRALFHEQVAAVGEVLEPGGAQNVRQEPFTPLRAEVRILGRPDQQRGVVKASQSVEELEGDAVVLCVELAGEGALGLGAAVTLGELAAM